MPILQIEHYCDGLTEWESVCNRRGKKCVGNWMGESKKNSAAVQPHTHAQPGLCLNLYNHQPGEDIIPKRKFSLSPARLSAFSLFYSLRSTQHGSAHRMMYKLSIPLATAACECAPLMRELRRAAQQLRTRGGKDSKSRLAIPSFKTFWKTFKTSTIFSFFFKNNFDTSQHFIKIYIFEIAFFERCTDFRQLSGIFRNSS